MQIKIFTIPIFDAETENEVLNLFLRNKKIIQIEQFLVQQNQAAFWTFSVKYLENTPNTPVFAQKTDFQQVLDEPTFARFSRLREIRKAISKEEAIPAYAIFTDEELANLAKLPELTAVSMKSVKGVGEKKIEKYADRFLTDFFQKT
jgi:superfamily II DNA helicase RecQ